MTETTETIETPGGAHRLLAEWRQALADDGGYLSASRVQDRLFDLWGELREAPAGRLVESWLTLSVQRDLFSASELIEFLDELELQLPETQPVG